jgi:hypothetical protein
MAARMLPRLRLLILALLAVLAISTASARANRGAVPNDWTHHSFLEHGVQAVTMPPGELATINDPGTRLENAYLIKWTAPDLTPLNRIWLEAYPTEVQNAADLRSSIEEFAAITREKFPGLPPPQAVEVVVAGTAWQYWSGPMKMHDGTPQWIALWQRLNGWREYDFTFRYASAEAEQYQRPTVETILASLELAPPYSPDAMLWERHAPAREGFSLALPHTGSYRDASYEPAWAESQEFPRQRTILTWWSDLLPLRALGVYWGSGHDYETDARGRPLFSEQLRTDTSDDLGPLLQSVELRSGGRDWLMYHADLPATQEEPRRFILAFTPVADGFWLVEAECVSTQVELAWTLLERVLASVRVEPVLSIASLPLSPVKFAQAGATIDLPAGEYMDEFPAELEELPPPFDHLPDAPWLRLEEPLLVCCVIRQPVAGWSEYTEADIDWEHQKALRKVQSGQTEEEGFEFVEQLPVVVTKDYHWEGFIGRLTDVEDVDVEFVEYFAASREGMSLVVFGFRQQERNLAMTLIEAALPTLRFAAEEPGSSGGDGA